MDGLTTTHTVTYTVLPDNHFTISAHKGKVRGKIRGDANGKITFYVKVPGPGTIDALVSAADREIAKTASVPAPAAHHFAYGRAHAHARRPATVKLVLKPNRMGRKLLRHHRGRIVLRLTVGFTPDHGIQRLSGVFGIHLAP